MPYPHGFPLCSTAEGPLAPLLLRLGRSVVTFDPPGAFRSARPARVDLPEMLECAAEALALCRVSGPVDVFGHSMGGFCALAFAAEHSQRVRRLLLVGAVSGGPAVRRAKGFPQNFRVIDRDFWRAVWWGLRLAQGRGNLAVHKRLLRLIASVSYHDPRQAPSIAIEAGDERRPAPVRDRWPLVVRRLDYGPRLRNVRAPALVCAGRFDPQAPVACSQELACGMPGARLVIFERSGHYPFVEEAEHFAAEVAAFMR